MTELSLEKKMALVGVGPASGLRDSRSNAVDRLPEEMNDLKLRDDKVIDASLSFRLSLLLKYNCPRLYKLLRTFSHFSGHGTNSG